jgi:hypothetical protein
MRDVEPCKNALPFGRICVKSSLLKDVVFMLGGFVLVKDSEDHSITSILCYSTHAPVFRD